MRIMTSRFISFEPFLVNFKRDQLKTPRKTHITCLLVKVTDCRSHYKLKLLKNWLTQQIHWEPSVLPVYYVFFYESSYNHSHYRDSAIAKFLWSDSARVLLVEFHSTFMHCFHFYFKKLRSLSREEGDFL